MIVDISKKILIVGLGLLGGSYARVLKRFGFHISAITLEQSSIDYALKENIIDEGSTDLDERMIGEADLVIFALYPHVFVEWIEKNQQLLKSGAIITDVTGVKRRPRGFGRREQHRQNVRGSKLYRNAHREEHA